MFSFSFLLKPFHEFQVDFGRISFMAPRWFTSYNNDLKIYG